MPTLLVQPTSVLPSVSFCPQCIRSPRKLSCQPRSYLLSKRKGRLWNTEGLWGQKRPDQPQSLLCFRTLPSTLPVSPVYLLKLLLNKQKQEQNKRIPFPSPFCFSCQFQSKAVGTFSLGPAPVSPHLTSAELRDWLPGQECCRCPRDTQSLTSYRAEALEPMSSDTLLLTWGQSSRKGDRFRGSGGGTVRAQGYDLLKTLLSTPTT